LTERWEPPKLKKKQQHDSLTTQKELIGGSGGRKAEDLSSPPCGRGRDTDKYGNRKP